LTKKIEKVRNRLNLSEIFRFKHKASSQGQTFLTNPNEKEISVMNAYRTLSIRHHNMVKDEIYDKKRIIQERTMGLVLHLRARFNEQLAEYEQYHEVYNAYPAEDLHPMYDIIQQRKRVREQID
jgi:UDP-N-acetyl-D-mannosaminuronic acid transferase (WecB/TagA/CpsF family)